jgi:hypothetical protein
MERKKKIKEKGIKMSEIAKSIMNQYFLYYDKKEMNAKRYSFLDELISLKIMIYDRFDDDCILMSEIYKGMEGIEWKEIEGKRVPYNGEGKRIRAIRL